MTKKSLIRLKYVFYFEGLLNLIMIILCIFFPHFFISQLTTATINQVGIEMVIWFGILLFVITFIMVGMLIVELKKAFLIVIYGYLFGDLLQIGATIHFALKLNSWTIGIIFTIIITLILMVFRLIVIIQPKFLGFKEKEMKDRIPS